jgi:mannosyltransferase OCH1-like enzyme
MTPRVLHQTWRNDAIPPRFQRFVESWHTHNADWRRELWTDARLLAFVRAHHPDLRARYETYPHHIQRIDAARYLLLFTLGGVYVDLDFECRRPLDPLLKGRSCVMGLEPDLHSRLHGEEQIIGNAFIAATPGHPFLAAVIEELHHYQPGQMSRNDLVLNTTGPFMLQRVYRRLGSPADVTLLPSDQMYPLTLPEAELVLGGGIDDVVASKIDRAFAVHYHAGTWWRR